jgi:lipid-A-disaccharide synthase
MRIFVSAGEPSGDLHAARLIRELRGLAPGTEFVGMGGPEMRAAGCRIAYPLTELAVMGFLRVLPMLGRFLAAYRAARRVLREQRPDAVVLVDFPGFHWWIAGAAKRAGIPVIYYLPPQLWAWAPWRLRKMRRLVDKVLCALPFEHEWFRSRGLDADFVGHPFFDEASERTLDAEFLTTLAEAAGDGKRLIAILPGSRKHEVVANFPVQMRAMEQLARRHPNVRFEVANFRDDQRELCRRMLEESKVDLPVTLHVGRTAEILAGCEAACMVSGSVSLELLAKGLPAVVVYRMSRWLYAIGRRTFIQCRFISLPNLIANEELMPEIIPAEPPSAAGDDAARILDQWLNDPLALADARRRMESLRERTVVAGASAAAAKRVMEFVGQRSRVTSGNVSGRKAA